MLDPRPRRWSVRETLPGQPSCISVDHGARSASTVLSVLAVVCEDTARIGNIMGLCAADAYAFTIMNILAVSDSA